jgi:hypothetical protein
MIDQENESGARLLTVTQFAEALRSSRVGPIMVLATRPVIGVMNLPGLAALMWSRWIAESGDDRVIQMNGSAPIQVIDSESLAYEHETRWLAAGVLYEQLLRHVTSEAPTVVLYLDLWAAQLDESVVAVIPTARRILISDLAQRSHGGEQDYWERISTWMQARSGLQIVAVNELAEAIPITVWKGFLADAAVSSLKTETERMMLVEESGIAPPEAAVLAAALTDNAEGDEVALLSPHVDWYQEHYPDLLRKCRAVWNPRDLSPAVYAALLMHADVYVTAHRLPFGPGPLSCLPTDCHCILHPADESTIPEIGISVMFPESTADLIAMLAPQGHVHMHPERAGVPIVNAEPLVGMHAWWNGLSHLIPETVVPLSAPSVAPVCDFSFLVCSFKYLQRFRFFIDSIARQTYPLERIEVCIAAGGNPDGLFEYLNLVRIVYPALTIRLLEIPEPLRRNKGKMLNEAFRASTAAVVMPTDCDIVFPKTFVADMLDRHQSDLVIGCWRTPLTKELTAQILVGNLDPVEHFDVLSKQWSKEEEIGGVRQGMLGYCQVVSRQAFAMVGYPEEFEGYNQSDIVFIERLRERAGVKSLFMKDYFVLHLSHARDWTGTKVFL